MQLIATDNRRVIVGLGLTGLSCARHLARRELPFVLVDSRVQPPGLADFRREFPSVSLTLGAISDEALRGVDELIVSPGVSLQEPAIARAIAAGATVCGDIDLFRREATAPVIGITGSNGKSTVTTLVGEMIAAAGRRVAVGGNIGVPALDLLGATEPDFYVLELSSFQLERAAALNLDVATVLNISEDHMDRYDDLQAYHRAKHRIFRGCRQVVINRADALTRPLVADDVKQWSFGLDQPDLKGFGLREYEGQPWLAFGLQALMPAAALKIAGRHNIENALAALAIGHAIGLPMAPMLDVLARFTGLPHRCQFVAEIGGVRFFNDSKGTNVGAAIAAIRGVADTCGKVVLIAGGEGKDADFSPLKPVLSAHARGAVLIGVAADELATLLGDALPLRRADSMDTAVREALQLAAPGDIVLLSPACASFDMFDDYQHRGRAFCAAVETLVLEARV